MASVRDRKDIKDAVDIFVSLAGDALCKTDTEIRKAIESGFGHRFHEGKVWGYSEELLSAKRKVIAEFLKAIPANVISENDIETMLWEAVVAADTKKDRESLFYGSIDSYITKRREFVGPNFLIRLITPVTRIAIGSVTIIATRELNEKYEQRQVEFRVGEANKPRFEGNVHIYEFPHASWVVSLVSSEEHVREEAEWQINIAISLLRLSLLYEFHPSGLFPRLGDVEMHPLKVTPIHEVGVVFEDHLVRFGGSKFSCWYEIDQSTIDHINKVDLDKIANVVFDPPSRSVAERLNKGLGWMTLARQIKPRAERFIHYFTALEALLTQENSAAAPVTQTISRYMSCILTNNNEDRIRLSSTMKSLYSKRSELVHGGKRTKIHLTDVRDIQYFTEIVYFKVLNSVDPSQKAEEFLKNLERATFGLNWPA